MSLERRTQFSDRRFTLNTRISDSMRVAELRHRTRANIFLRMFYYPETDVLSVVGAHRRLPEISLGITCFQDAIVSCEALILGQRSDGDMVKYGFQLFPEGIVQKVAYNLDRQSSIPYDEQDFVFLHSRNGENMMVCADQHPVLFIQERGVSWAIGRSKHECAVVNFHCAREDLIASRLALQQYSPDLPEFADTLFQTMKYVHMFVFDQQDHIASADEY